MESVFVTQFLPERALLNCSFIMKKKASSATSASRKKIVSKSDKPSPKPTEKASRKAKTVKPRLRPTTASKVMAKAFPMSAQIDDQVRKSIPADLVETVKSTTSKKQIISPTYPYPKTMKGRIYDEQIELVKMQAWVNMSGERIVMLFEGRDAVGKGGTIQLFTENLNPRGARVVALAKPSETERGQWYFQRYVEQMPTKGEILFFDRSWYNRAGVENVMGFCNPTEYLEFMRQAPEFERMFVRSGIHLFKFWFSVNRTEQLRRFLGRAQDPLKQWKLSPMDVESLGRWDRLHQGQGGHAFYTDTADAPWTIVRSDAQETRPTKRDAISAQQHPLRRQGQALLADLDPLIVGSAKDIYESDESARRYIFRPFVGVRMANLMLCIGLETLEEFI
ncbi:MAG: polyphosphate kinase 2 [Candidatus Synoicihabitans palmerolidicus]|nr:polyphosphate kinase 2 [Candidatus Synoicihabitans palmerolidicus]